MRIETTQIQEAAGAQGKAKPDSGSIEVKAGDTLEAKVILSEKGTVNLKTNDGILIRAKLENEAPISPGDKVTLVAIEKVDNTIYFALQKSDEVSVSQRFVTIAAPIEETLEAFISKLDQLRLPSGKETAAAMRELLALNPGMTVDEAAFLAANKIPADTPLAGAAKALLTDGNKTDAMVQQLISLLESAGDAPEGTGENKNAPLIKWLTGILEKYENTDVPAEKADSSAETALTGKTAPGAEAELAGKTAPGAETALAGKTAPGAEAELAGKTAPGAETALAEKTVPGAETAQAGKTVPGSETAAGEKTAFQEAKQAVTGFLREMPEFRGTPEKTLSEFSEKLLNAAVKAAATSESGGETKKLTALLEGLFERLPARNENGGETIRRAKDELYMRLAMFEEALSSSDTPSKAAILKETESLMNFVKLQNNIDQFVYMQLPIKLGDENKTAELYVFKQRKGGKSIDPENASILLTLDLENMGHTESFVKIRGREVTLQTEVETDGARTFFTENTRQLHDLLAGINYRLAGMNVSCAKGETTPLNALVSLLEREKRQALGIDYRV